MKDTTEILMGIMAEFEKPGRAFDLKHFASKDFFITGEETTEDLKAKIGTLTRELYKPKIIKQSYKMKYLN